MQFWLSILAGVRCIFHGLQEIIMCKHQSEILLKKFMKIYTCKNHQITQYCIIFPLCISAPVIVDGHIVMCVLVRAIMHRTGFN